MKDIKQFLKAAGKTWKVKKESEGLYSVGNYSIEQIADGAFEVSAMNSYYTSDHGWDGDLVTVGGARTLIDAVKLCCITEYAEELERIHESLDTTHILDEIKGVHTCH